MNILWQYIRLHRQGIAFSQRCKTFQFNLEDLQPSDWHNLSIVPDLPRIDCLWAFTLKGNDWLVGLEYFTDDTPPYKATTFIQRWLYNVYIRYVNKNLCNYKILVGCIAWHQGLQACHAFAVQKCPSRYCLADTGKGCSFLSKPFKTTFSIKW